MYESNIVDKNVNQIESNSPVKQQVYLYVYLSLFSLFNVFYVLTEL